MYAWRSNQRCTPTLFPSTVGMVSLFFVLIVLFWLGNSTVSMTGVPVSLPRVENAQVEEVNRMLVTMTADGRYFFNGRLLQLEELRKALREHVRDARNADAKAAGEGDERLSGHSARPMVMVFRADRTITLEAWMQVADMARANGLSVYLVTEPLPRRQEAVPSNNVSRDSKP